MAPVEQSQIDTQHLGALLNYSQSLVELAWLIPDQPELVKEILFLALKTQSSPQQLTNTIRDFGLAAKAKASAEVDGNLVDLSLAADMSSQDLRLMVNCTRALAKIPFQDWRDYASVLGTLSPWPKERAAGMSAIESLAAQSDFSAWKDLFTTLKVLAEDFPQSTSRPQSHFHDSLLTIRQLSEKSGFGVWGSFFSCLKQLQSKTENERTEALASLRRTITFFRKDSSFDGILRLLSSYPKAANALSYGQLDSKKWMIEEATQVFGQHWGTVFILAGWAGVTARFIFDFDIEVTKIRSFDIDPEVHLWAETLNRKEVMNDWRFKASEQDIYQLKYPSTYRVKRADGTECELFDSPDLVINTSCEHMRDIEAWWSQIPKGTRVILQSNDGFHIPDHSRCFESLSAFQKAMNLSELVFAGEKALPEFNRYMLIGTK